MKNTLTHLNWWKSLSPQWRQAFAMSVLLHSNEPVAAELEQLLNMQVLRLAGPGAPFSNCSIELTDLSGIAAMHQLETMIVTHHAIETIAEVAALTRLKSLFLFNNRINNLEGIEGLQYLEQLYVQCNQLSSIKPIRNLLNLKEVYISDNNLTSLDGLTEAHADNLKKFVCLPNENLKQKEIIHVERDLGIICR